MARKRKSEKTAVVDTEADLRMAQQFVRKGTSLLQREQFERALEAYMEVENQFGKQREAVLAEQVAIALLKSSVIVGVMSDTDDAIGLCDVVIDRYETKEAVALQVQVAKAKLIQSPFLDNNNEPDEALDNCDWVIERYRHSEELALLECVAQAFLTKANSLRNIKEPLEEQLEPLDELLDRFRIGQSRVIDDQIATALGNKGLLLGLVLGREEESIFLYDRLIELFEADQSPVLAVQIIKAQVNKAVMLSLLDRFEETHEVCDKVVTQFEFYPEPYLSELLPAQQMMGIFDSEDVTLSRIIGLRIRARACFANGADEAGGRALEELLELLPRSGKVNKPLLDTLAFIAYRSGPKRLLALIEASPSLDMLQPMVDSIQSEIASGSL